MDRAYLKPTTRPPVPLPDGTPWPTEGREVDVDLYVRRRLADGDLVSAEPDDGTGPEDEVPADGEGDPEGATASAADVPPVARRRTRSPSSEG